MILSYAAGALGVLSFVWGFLDWFGSGVGAGLSGYSVGGGPAGAVIGLALVAGLLAAATTFEKKELGIGPAAIAAAGLLVAFGVLVGHGDSADTKIGLILAFITAIVQTAALVVAWLLTTGKLASLGGGSSSQPANQWQGQNPQRPGPQGPGPQGPGPQGPGQQGPGPQGQFGGFPGEQGQFGPPPGYGPPPSQESAPSYGPPSGYGPPPQAPAPSYGPPSQEPAPSYGPPSGPPSGYGPPSQPPAPQPPAPPQPAPPSSTEDDASRTQVLPRFQPDQNSTQQGIPIFDPQSGPDERPGEDPQR